jgi:hypothetical protein
MMGGGGGVGFRTAARARRQLKADLGQILGFWLISAWLQDSRSNRTAEKDDTGRCGGRGSQQLSSGGPKPRDATRQSEQIIYARYHTTHSEGSGKGEGEGKGATAWDQPFLFT